MCPSLTPIVRLKDPNFYTKTKTELYVGRRVRVRDDADFDLPDGPGRGDTMEDWGGCESVIEYIVGEDAVWMDQNLTWVQLADNDEKYTWDLRWLELL